MFWCNQQCQGQNPRQGIITPEVKCSDAIDNVKDKIQDKYQGIITLDVEFSDAIDNTKAEIEDKGLSP